MGLSHSIVFAFPKERDNCCVTTAIPEPVQLDAHLDHLSQLSEIVAADDLRMFLPDFFVFGFVSPAPPLSMLPLEPLLNERGRFEPPVCHCWMAKAWICWRRRSCGFCTIYTWIYILDLCEFIIKSLVAWLTILFRANSHPSFVF